MRRKKLKLPDQISFLAESGTLDQLRAVSYFQGKVHGGRVRLAKLGDAARDMTRLGMNAFLDGLTPSERSRYDEILATVRMTREMEEATKSAAIE